MAGERSRQHDRCSLSWETGSSDSSAYVFRINSPTPHSEVHLNIATPLAIAKREGWTARLCDRGGIFNVIEFWLENKLMLELTTEAESKRYRGFMTPANARAMIARGPAPGPQGYPAPLSYLLGTQFGWDN